MYERCEACGEKKDEMMCRPGGKVTEQVVSAVYCVVMACHVLCFFVLWCYVM